MSLGILRIHCVSWISDLQFSSFQPYTSFQDLFKPNILKTVCTEGVGLSSLRKQCLLNTRVGVIIFKKKMKNLKANSHLSFPANHLFPTVQLNKLLKYIVE